MKNLSRNLILLKKFLEYALEARGIEEYGPEDPANLLLFPTPIILAH